MANETPEQKQMAQDALNRWWWPSLMMFGPPDNDSPNSKRALHWKIKRATNDTLRQKFIDKTVPQVEFLNLTVPDPDMKFNEETGHYEIGPIDWEEFYRVIRGYGPCNKQRLKAHIQAHEDGAWVREAAAAYAERQTKETIAV